ncbi:SLBB domain-containing protein [Leucothrix pacifica]|uniref:Polysaccharide export protein n=1 Tax=Leucothrix pacifica TaxID=1247513 RepID=A0A317CHM3_9GAMM|nr:polysaccharide biosynthesis/export family protein [Leucothrix pacifica]PWQ95790.1 hypothetical protein DKW60_13895 [Leucothrix pacifica]
MTACSAGGNLSGAFGTPAPSGTFESLSVANTPQQARRVAGGANTNPRIIADMRELAQYRSNDVYRIGPSDLLNIKVFQASELSGEVRVDQRGSITLPLIGNIRVAGLTQVQAEQRLAQLLGANLLQNPQVSVFIKEFTNQRVTVEGEVRKPGVYPLSGQVTLLQAIAMSGGLGERAKVDTVAVFRKQGSGHRVYYVDIDLIREGQANDPFVRNDDRIVIQRMETQRVTVEGEVKKPGVFTFEEPTTVLQSIALSQGLTSLGAPNRVILFRRDNTGEKAYGVDLTAIRQGTAPDPYVQSGDRIVVHRSNSRYWLGQALSILSPLNLLSTWVN